MSRNGSITKAVDWVIFDFHLLSPRISFTIFFVGKVMRMRISSAFVALAIMQACDPAAGMPASSNGTGSALANAVAEGAMKTYRFLGKLNPLRYFSGNEDAESVDWNSETESVISEMTQSDLSTDAASDESCDEADDNEQMKEASDKQQPVSNGEAVDPSQSALAAEKKERELAAAKADRELADADDLFWESLSELTKNACSALMDTSTLKHLKESRRNAKEMLQRVDDMTLYAPETIRPLVRDILEDYERIHDGYKDLIKFNISRKTDALHSSIKNQLSLALASLCSYSKKISLSGSAQDLEAYRDAETRVSSAIRKCKNLADEASLCVRKFIKVMEKIKKTMVENKVKIDEEAGKQQKTLIGSFTNQTRPTPMMQTEFMSAPREVIDVWNNAGDLADRPLTQWQRAIEKKQCVFLAIAAKRVRAEGGLSYKGPLRFDFKNLLVKDSEGMLVSRIREDEVDMSSQISNGIKAVENVMKDANAYLDFIGHQEAALDGLKIRLSGITYKYAEDIVISKFKTDVAHLERALKIVTKVQSEMFADD